MTLPSASPAAAHVLPATGGDPEAPGAVDAEGGPDQAAGTGDQEPADGLRTVLSRGPRHPCPQGHQEALWGGPEPNHRSPRTTTISIFYTRKLLVTERDPSGTWCHFPVAFSPLWFLPRLVSIAPCLLLNSGFKGQGGPMTSQR